MRLEVGRSYCSMVGQSRAIDEREWTKEYSAKSSLSNTRSSVREKLYQLGRMGNLASGNPGLGIVGSTFGVFTSSRVREAGSSRNANRESGESSEITEIESWYRNAHF